MILLNAAQCRLCKAVVVSRTRHDFVRCDCGTIAVDGGREYVKRVSEGELDDFVELAIFLTGADIERLKVEINEE